MFLAFSVAPTGLLAQTPPPPRRGVESGAEKTTQLTVEDRESILKLKSRMDDQFRIQKQAEEAQAKLGQELQRKLLELGKKCGGTVALDNEHHVICQKPEAPKEAPNAQAPR